MYLHTRFSVGLLLLVLSSFRILLSVRPRLRFQMLVMSNKGTGDKVFLPLPSTVDHLLDGKFVHTVQYSVYKMLYTCLYKMCIF